MIVFGVQCSVLGVAVRCLLLQLHSAGIALPVGHHAFRCLMSQVFSPSHLQVFK